MIVRPCTTADIIYILENPWDITKKEIEHFFNGTLNNEEIAQEFLGNNFGYSFVIIDPMGNPVWAFGVATLNETDWTAWALYGKDFLLYKRQAIQLYNDTCVRNAKIQRDLDGKFERIILVTAVDSPIIARWCRIIGFNKTSDRSINELYGPGFGVYIREFY